jgi:GTP-binding protein
MPIPTVAIVGRPNVGKSTLFNRLVGKRLALVDDRPGVTPGRMRQQTEAAVQDADAALFLIDAREGITPLDEEIGRWLRAETTPVVVVGNKAEGSAGESGLLDAYRLGLGDPIGISAEHGEGIADLFQALLPHVEHERFDADEEELDAERPLHVAIVGRPNAGKSTLVNRMLGEERMITGPEAGITRDSIGIDWEWQGRPVRLVDTAGLRKRAKVDDKLERLSAADSRRAIDYAEVVVLLLDATRGLEAQDLKIAAQVIEEGRVLIIALNKWDVAENASSLFNGVKGALDEGLAQLRDVPLLTVSGKTGKGIDMILKVAFELREAWGRRVPTGELNRWFERAIDANPPPAPKGQRIKLRYITQVNSRPPTFVVFGNRTDELPESYRRYLLNAMRRDLGLGPVPVRLDFRGRSNPFDKARR